MRAPLAGRIALLLALMSTSPALGASQEESARAAAVRAALAAGNAQGALSAARELALARPDSAEALTLLGHALRLSGDVAGAAGAYASAERLDDAAPEPILGMAGAYEVTGDLERAAAAYERALALVPDNLAALRGAGQALMRQTQYARATEHFRHYLEIDPTSGDVRYLAGVAAQLAGDNDLGIEILEEGLRLQPDAIPLEYALGVILADRPEDHDRALELLAAAEAAGWEPADAAYLQGRILADRGDHAGAVAALRRSLAIRPDKLDAVYRLAQSLSRLGERDEAREQMQRFAALQKAFNENEYREKRLGTLENELEAALEAGDGPRAEQVADDLVAAAPEDPDVLVRAGKVWISAGEIDRAFDLVEAAAQIDPGHWEARYLEGLLLLGKERPRDALVALDASVSANPLFADSYNLVGNALSLLGEPKRAIEAYLAAIDLDTDNPGYYLNLAGAYRDAGRPDLEAQALAEYRRRQSERTPSR